MKTKISSSLPFLLTISILLTISSPSSQTLVSATTPFLFPRDTNDASTEYTNDSSFQKAILNVTNTYRSQHNATGLRWNNTLADSAKKWSEGCVFEHSGGPTGENLSSGYPNASASVVAWGDEREAYNFKKGEFSEKVGHFTQLVWKGTTAVGCGRTRCDGKKKGGGKDGAPGWFVVCEYWPAGNVLRQFTENVQPQVNNDNKPAEVPTGTAPSPTSSEPAAQPSKCPMGGVCSNGERIARQDLTVFWGGFILSTLLGCSI